MALHITSAVDAQASVPSSAHDGYRGISRPSLPNLVARIEERIGNTPLLLLDRYGRHEGIDATILGKAEFFNPAGSIKDRTALAIIRDAERSGKLRPGDLIVDVTSGNTGISLAAIAAVRGYRTKFYHSDNISPDKVKLLRLYGAETVSVRNEFFLDPEALEKIARWIRRENPKAFYADQLANPANPRVHFDTTGPEIWRDTTGTVDIVVGALGTGGTISGIGRFLKMQKPGIRIVLAEPSEDSVPTEQNPYPEQIDGVHKVTDVPPKRLPRNFDPAVVDDVLAVSTSQARATAQALAQREGVLAGPSSGAALRVATEIARRPEHAGATIVAILADSGERYLSSYSET